MKKLISLLIAILLIGITSISAEEKKQEDGNDGEKTEETTKDIVTDLPFPREVTGTIFGSIEKINNDIDIVIPEEPQDPDKPGNSGSNSNNGNSGNNSNSNNSNNSSNNGNGGNTHYPNIPNSNQGSYDIDEDGTSTNDKNIVYYKWVKNKKTLDIYVPMFEKAKSEKKNIVMRIIDEDSKEMRFRVRLKYEDIKDYKPATMTFVFGEACEHKPKIEELLMSGEARSLLQCKQEDVSIPVYIGVAVPETWDHDYGVYQYEYTPKESGDDGNFKLIRKDLQIDQENFVEILMKSKTDYVFYNRTVLSEGYNLLTWVKGLSGNSDIVDQGNAVTATLLFLVGIGLLGGAGYIYLDGRRKKLKVTLVEEENDNKKGENEEESL